VRQWADSCEDREHRPVGDEGWLLALSVSNRSTSINEIRGAGLDHTPITDGICCFSDEDEDTDDDDGDLLSGAEANDEDEDEGNDEDEGTEGKGHAGDMRKARQAERREWSRSSWAKEEDCRASC